jgi:hypothetical protein
MLNFVENLLENERGPMNDQDLTKTDYDPDRSLVLISHFLTNLLRNLASCQTSLTSQYLSLYIFCFYITLFCYVTFIIIFLLLSLYYSIFVSLSPPFFCCHIVSPLSLSTQFKYLQLILITFLISCLLRLFLL